MTHYIRIQKITVIYYRVYKISDINLTIKKCFVCEMYHLQLVRIVLSIIFFRFIFDIDKYLLVSKILAYMWWNRQTTNDACKLRSSLSWQYVVHLCGFSVSGQLEAAELILLSTTKPLRQPDRTQLLLLQMAGDVHPNPNPATKYPCY